MRLQARNGRNFRPRRDECIALKIADVASEGLLAPGKQASGQAGLLGRNTEFAQEVAEWVPIRAQIGELDGILTIGRASQVVRVVARPTQTHRGLLWSFQCGSCSRLVRALLRRECEPDAPLRCRWCLGVTYRSWRRRSAVTRRQHRAELARLRAEIDRLARILGEEPDR
jgi:hypothetical protein